MNYRQLGKRAAKMLIQKAEETGGEEKIAEEHTAEESAAEEKGLWGKMPESSVTENHVNRMMVGMDSRTGL